MIHQKCSFYKQDSNSCDLYGSTNCSNCYYNGKMVLNSNAIKLVHESKLKKSGLGNQKEDTLFFTR